MNEILKKKGLDTYCVDSAMNASNSVRNRCVMETIPRDWFVRLQRLYAYFIARKKPAPLHGSHDPEDDEVLEHALSSGCTSHLICHGSEGLYVPVSFTKPVFDSSGVAPGGWIGSVKNLSEELAQLAPFLKISLRPVRGTVRRGGGYDISEGDIRDLNAVFFSKDDEDENFERERKAWFYLFEAARTSMITKSVVMMIHSELL